MKRMTITAILTLALLGLVIPAQASKPAGPCRGFNPHSPAEMQQLIRCVFRAVGIPEEIDMALYVSYRESRYNPHAWNHAIYFEHDCLGLFQQMRQYWRGRAITYLPLRYFPKRAVVGAFHARANAWVSARMVKASGGWGAWTTA